jgi:hypothetical protein
MKYIIVGSQLEDQDSGTVDSGAAYVFAHTGDSWSQEARLQASFTWKTNQFGNSVDISYDGSRVIVGAWKTITPVTRNGSAYIFTRVNGSWSEEARLLQDDTGVDRWFGTSVSISNDGSRALIGTPREREAGLFSAGVAYVFNRYGNTWYQMTRVTTENPQTDGYFGESLSISGGGDHAIISDKFGGTYLFSLPSGSGFDREATLVDSSTYSNTNIGQASDLSNTGDRAIVGIPFSDDDGLTNNGAVFVFDLSPGTGQLIASGNALVAKGSTIKSYDINGDAVTSIIDMPAMIGDLTILDDGRVLATSHHGTAMTYDPVSGNVTSVQGPRSLGRATRLLDGKVWTEGGVVFQSGSSVSTPLTATIGLSSFVNP